MQSRETCTGYPRNCDVGKLSMDPNLIPTLRKGLFRKSCRNTFHHQVQNFWRGTGCASNIFDHHQWNMLTKRNVNRQWRADLQKPSLTAVQAQSSMHISHPLRCLVIPEIICSMYARCGMKLALWIASFAILASTRGQGSSQIGTDVHVANNAVTSLAGVIPDSQVIKDRFESIGGDDTFAF